MKTLIIYPVLCSLLLYFNNPSVDPVDLASQNEKKPRITEEHCSTSFSGKVHVFNLKEGGRHIGNSIWISRDGQRCKAKYFAFKTLFQSVPQRFESWGQHKKLITISSGAYANGFKAHKKPIGITVDNGKIVNKKYETKMDGLVIIEAVGGVRISNIEDGELHLQSLNKRINVKNGYDRSKFLNWAVAESATVFQTHLLVYKNKLQLSRYNSKSAKTIRKLLVLAKDNNGELFHIVFYPKGKEYTLFEVADLLLDHMQGEKMNVIAAVNLDTGGLDILTSAGNAKDCNSKHVVGTQNAQYPNMTNLLTYYYE